MSSASFDRPAATPPAGRILLARADDAGICAAADDAIVQCVTQGVARNVSLQAVGPTIARAAELLRGIANVSLGCHVTITCEWTSPRFGPLSTGERASAMTLNDGGFPHEASPLLEHVSVDVLCEEAELQIHRLRSLGLTIDYLDTHMGISWLPGLHDRLITLCARHKLIYVDALVKSDAITTSPAPSDPRPRLLIGHPMHPRDAGSPYGPRMDAEQTRQDRARQRDLFLVGPIVDAVRGGQLITKRFADSFAA